MREAQVRKIAFCGAIIFAVAGLSGPVAPFLGWPRKGLLHIINETGSLSAGLLALSAGLWTILAAFQIRSSEVDHSRQVAAASCLAQIESAWLHIDRNNTFDRLSASIEELRGILNSVLPALPARADDPLDTYRGHLGDHWLTLQTASPQIFGALPTEIAQKTTSYFSRMLNIIGRLNWMNDQHNKVSQVEWVLTVHELSRQQLAELQQERLMLVAALRETLREGLL